MGSQPEDRSTRHSRSSARQDCSRMLDLARKTGTDDVSSSDADLIDLYGEKQRSGVDGFEPTPRGFFPRAWDYDNNLYHLSRLGLKPYLRRGGTGGRHPAVLLAGAEDAGTLFLMTIKTTSKHASFARQLSTRLGELRSNAMGATTRTPVAARSRACFRMVPTTSAMSLPLIS